MAFIATLVYLYQGTIERSTISQTRKIQAKEIHNTLSFLQGSILTILNTKETNNIKQIISNMAGARDLNVIVVVDAADNIIASSDYRIVGESWNTTDLQINHDLLKAARDYQSIELENSSQREFLNGYAGLCVSTIGLRPTNCGFIFYSKNLDYHNKLAIHSLRNSINKVYIILFSGCGLLMLLIHILVTFRIGRLVKLIHNFSQGNRHQRIHCWGQDEIRTLGDQINALFDNICDNEKEILEREKHLESMSNSVTYPILETDKHGIIRNANQAAEQLFNTAQLQLIGKPIGKFIILKYENIAQLWDALQSENDRQFNTMATREDGSQFSAKISLQPIYQQDIYIFAVDESSPTNRRKTSNVVAGTNMSRQIKLIDQQLKSSATKDALTTLNNRRVFDKTLERELQQALRSKTPLSLVIVEIDFFDRYNALYGHESGDRCLQQIAETLNLCYRRSNDTVARFGGKTFAAILPDTDQGATKQLAETTLEVIRELDIPYLDSEISTSVTISIGTATHDGSNPAGSADILRQKAEQALTKAKSDGHNRYAA
ncbi:MAG: diguanylate cyclase [Gammaproteobacteria bacterium]|nr:diguanylate cyclase [Gammaproteobacteria bacterium]